MNTQEIESLTTAYQDFVEIIERFQHTYEVLQKKVDLLNSQLESKNLELEKKYSEGETIKNFLHNVLENIYTGVTVIDNNGIVTHFNRAAEMITGFHKDDIIGKSYSTLNINKKTDTRSALYTLSSGKESYHRQKNILTSDKQEKSVEFSTTLLKDHENNIQGVVETFNDISEIKLLQERIMNVETLAALGEMSASVAHEIRNPLAGIMGFAGLLDRQIEEDDPRKTLVKSILQGTTKLNGIISNLLTLTRPHDLKRTQASLYEFLDNVLKFFEMTMSMRDKEIQYELDIDDKETMICLDTQLFQQIILNLLKNSFDAIEEKGKISIKTKCSIFEPISEVLEEDEKNEMIKLFSFVEISISDNGCGISEEILQKIFNPFFTTKNEGNGLGLAISKKIIQLHNGDIQIKSQVGKGTTFIINLPLYEQPT